MKSALRFFAILVLAFWVGGIFFFGAIMAPTVFHSLPTHTLAGLVIFPTLTKLHYLGLACGLLFILFALLRAKNSTVETFKIELALVALMMVLTCYAQFRVGREDERHAVGYGRHRSDPAD